MSTSPLKFSIIIPTLNEQKALPILLHDLALQSNQNFEIIVVDGKSEDKTVQEFEKFKRQNPAISAHLYQVPKRHVSYQRNFGASKAHYDWLIFMDADNQLPTFFLQGITYQLEKNATQVDLFSTLIHLNKTDARDRFYHTIAKGINFFLISRDKSAQPLAFGSLIGARRSLFTKVTFNENSKVMEDSIFIKKARRLGFKFKLFHEPTFAYSMRRIKGKGLFQTASSSFLMQMRYIFGDEFTESDCGYEMLGGENYQTTKKKSLFKQS